MSEASLASPASEANGDHHRRGPAPDARTNAGGGSSLSTPGALLVIVVLVLPVLWLFYRVSFTAIRQPDLAHYTRLLAASLHRDLAHHLRRVSGIVTVLCVLIGYPVAYFMVSFHRAAAPLRR